MEKEINKDNADFVIEYGKSWKNFDDKIFLAILTFTLFFTFVFILFIANKDYSASKIKLSKQITRKYLQTLFSDIKIDIPGEPIDSTIFYSNINTNTVPAPNTKDNGEPGSGGLADADSPGDISGLNLDDANLPEALVTVKNRSNVESHVRPIQQGKNKAPDFTDSKPFDPWETPIQRHGELYIEPVEEIIRGSQIVRGWRDPDEITFALQKKEPMIEYCYKREAKFFTDLNGYVIVRFIILHTGFVDPSSVQIIKSTLFNKQIESCIKNRLRKWRGFEKLDVSMGSVAVVQKFIFD